MKPFLLALQFLTVITLKSDLRAEAADLERSRAWYAAVGVVLGLLLAGAGWLMSRVLPPLALAAALVVLWGALTRFLHLDGLADTADALVHTATRERALEIMRDSRIGSFGVCAVGGVLLLKFAALASLDGQRLFAALALTPPLARALAAMLCVLLPPARGQGLGASVAGQAGLGPELIAGLAAMALAGLAAGRAGLAAALAVCLTGLVLARWYARRLGGFTGDTVGAAMEISEAAALVTLCAL